jgi:hypothetical protein
MIELPLLEGALRTRRDNDRLQVFDIVRRQWVSLTPEEHVRQLLLHHLIDRQEYPTALIAVEQGIVFSHTTLRFDLVVYHRDTQRPWMLAECKSPEVDITTATLQQLLQYHSKLTDCRYWLLTNGHNTYCADAIDPGNIVWLRSLPAY